MSCCNYYKIATAAVVLIALSACTANQYAHKAFGDAPVEKFKDEATDLTYFIWDKPGEQRLKISMSLGGTLNMVMWGRNAVPPMPVFESAAVAFLATSDRACTITRSFEIIMGEVEMSYACTPITR